MRAYIGTSGYHYKDWKGDFYPKDLKKSEWLQFYADEFETLEINNTFYNTPSRKSFESWYNKTPSKFKFSIKGSRYVTHMKKLNEPQEPVSNLYQAIDPLKEKIDCILWQLPGNLHFDAEKLKKFGEVCSKDFVNVVEFRHESWFVEETFEILSDHNLAYCIISAPPAGLPEIAQKTVGTAYMRFHGKNNWYDYHYSKQELKTWAEKIKKLNPARAFIYFNNDVNACAVENARQLQEMIK